MNYELRSILRPAYEEHMSRRNMRRILPRTVHKPQHTGLAHSELDRLLILWFDVHQNNTVLTGEENNKLIINY
ncbi:unnamed protein product [Gongylonema pulchrum]|uniref:HTH CENPB-type domain-containing protein n=1 Tax=Gongylonema pulchrum TaxID=637853 RepID=A0A183DNY7_9BILA|nr:unnamed protein product [Gongylonema pulchrum]